MGIVGKRGLIGRSRVVVAGGFYGGSRSEDWMNYFYDVVLIYWVVLVYVVIMFLWEPERAVHMWLR